MKGWRVMLMALSFLLLSGCLVTFTQPLDDSRATPAGLVGKWSSKNVWGEPQTLVISAVAKNRYKAVIYAGNKSAQHETYPFSVTRHGSRWYASAALPARLGGNYGVAGFELTDKGELVIYELDLEQIQQAIGQLSFDGQPVETAEGSGVLINSPPAKVFAYLDDPANSDVFVEAARYQRVAK